MKRWLKRKLSNILDLDERFHRYIEGAIKEASEMVAREAGCRVDVDSKHMVNLTRAVDRIQHLEAAIVYSPAMNAEIGLLKERLDNLEYDYGVSGGKHLGQMPQVKPFNDDPYKEPRRKKS